MKNKFPIFIAGLFGVIALLAVRSYMNKQEQSLQSQLRGDPVVVAGRAIPAGTELTAQLLKKKGVPRQFMPAQAIEVDQVKQILGRKTAVAIDAGQTILWSDLVREGRGGLASIIPSGEGAYTVSIGKGIKPGLLQPSDHVDIIGSFAAPKPNQPMPATIAANWRQGSDMVNIVLLQNVTVLAVGDVFNNGATKSQGTSGTDLTLSLTLPESQLLMFASEHGELGAVLRRDGDADVKPRAELPRLTFEAIDKLIGDLDGRRNMRLVEVQHGIQSTTVPVVSPTTESPADAKSFDHLEKSSNSNNR